MGAATADSGYSQMRATQLGAATTGYGSNWARLQLGAATTGYGYNWERATTGCGYNWVQATTGQGYNWVYGLQLGRATTDKHKTTQGYPANIQSDKTVTELYTFA